MRDGIGYLYGGSGADTFHFDRTEDRDVIKDFQNNADRIEFDGFSSGFDPFDYASQVGGDVVFDLPGSDRLIVEDILLGQLGNDVFVV